MKLRLEVIGIAVMLICPAFAKVTIDNVIATQREGTKLVDIHYDVTSDVTNLVDVAIRLSDGAMDLAAYSFSGDIGESVSTGTGKLIVWNAGADQSNIAATVQVHLIIDDGASDPNVYVPPCPVAQTGQNSSYYSGDDGALKKGNVWPEPRFETIWLNDGREVTVDLFTGLMWHFDYQWDNGGGVYGQAVSNWIEAVSFCNTNITGGFSDWRIPTINEYETLRKCSGTPAVNPEALNVSQLGGYYWSGSTDAFSTNMAWVFDVGAEVSVKKQFKSDTLGRVFSVRSVQPNAAQKVAATGQSLSYFSGDDGDLSPGVSWPTPRYIDNGNTVIDRLTGLMWLKDAGSFSPKNWTEALDVCSSLTAGGYDDWRLPNVNEMASLIDHSQFSPALSPGHPFDNVQDAYYWTSTRSRVGADWSQSAHVVSLNTGERKGDTTIGGQWLLITDKINVWPVRGGE